MGWENLIVGLEKKTKKKHGLILIYPTYSFVLNCSRGLYCLFSNFSPPKSFYNDSPVLPKCEIRTYPHILLSISLPYWAFLISQETENLKSKNKYQVGTNYHSLKMSKAQQVLVIGLKHFTYQAKNKLHYLNTI